MKKVILAFKNALLSFWGWAGPLGSIVAVLVFVLVIHRLVMPVVTNGSAVEVSADTIIMGIQRVAKLKPYKVITAGFDTEIRQDGKAKAELYYQYKGMVEFVVDLSKMKVSIDDDTVKVCLMLPSISNPYMLPMPTNRLWHVKASGKMSEQFRQERGKIMSLRMSKDANTPENLEKAKEQTERILRSLFLPIGIDESKIKFEWRDDTSSKQN